MQRGNYPAARSPRKGVSHPNLGSFALFWVMFLAERPLPILPALVPRSPTLIRLSIHDFWRFVRGYSGRNDMMMHICDANFRRPQPDGWTFRQDILDLAIANLSKRFVIFMPGGAMIKDLVGLGSPRDRAVTPAVFAERHRRDGARHE